MGKLDVMRDNIKRFKAQRENCRLKSSDILTRVHSEHGSIADRVMEPPQDLINLYLMEAEVYTRENLLGDATHTREQMRVMLEETLMSKWRVHSASDAMGCSNHRSFWKPSVRTCNGHTLQLFLGHTLIGSMS